MRTIFLLLAVMMLTGCVTTKTVYVDRVVYLYPEDKHLVDNRQAQLMPIEEFKQLSIDDQLSYVAAKYNEQTGNLRACLLDKRAIRKWKQETSAAKNRESSPGSK